MGRDQDDFESMFNEGVALDEGTVTEDMAAGLDLEEAVEEQSEQEGQPMESGAEEAAEGEGAPSAAPAEESMEGAEPEIGEGEHPASGMDIKKEMQRLKSWEGRLKAREAELKAKEQTPAGAPDVETAVAVMESQPIDEVMATLAEDFGDDFVAALNQVIEARASEIASKVADEKVGAVAGNVDQLISSLTDERARNHFEMISDAHPDFMDVAQMPEFRQWVESQGEQAKAAVQNGSARQVIKLLNDFKSAGQGAEPDAAMMAAQSVKGRGGMRLPAKPEVADDYEAAWNSFS